MKNKETGNITFAIFEKSYRGKGGILTAAATAAAAAAASAAAAAADAAVAAAAAAAAFVVIRFSCCNSYLIYLYNPLSALITA